MYLLLGKHAQQFAEYIDDDYHKVMEWVHPSPQAQRYMPDDKKFIKCPHFAACSELCGIDWNISRQDGQHISDKTLKKKSLSSVYNDLCESKEITSEPDILQAFTDGSCLYNGETDAIGGFAVIFVGGALKGKKIKGKIKGKASNIRAEGKAIIHVLKRAEGLDSSAWRKLEIYTDSNFWIKMITEYMPKWPMKKFNEMANPDLTKQIWALWNSFPSHELELIFVPAHGKGFWDKSPSAFKQWCYTWNEAVDKLATEARQ